MNDLQDFRIQALMPRELLVLHSFRAADPGEEGRVFVRWVSSVQAPNPPCTLGLPRSPG